METTTIIVFMCLAFGLIGTILSFVGYKFIKSKKISIIFLSIGIVILLLSNYFLYSNITKDPKELEKDLKSVITPSVDSKQESSYKGLEKIREERNKAMKESKGH